ncbi:hypothetical protein [Natranaeroarchaeum aerophilus]|uniref:HIT-type domain-containing protein n=1 Tax=Natranaeroarchaeum aerophilus TaxID=2917711 RepID=A0AAE3FND6_9EURY|nr:hypothetical protein [Natranaeroarchaeum aerophilus]MCL9812737.1 hypothetical protein [Natranaeroarchaeum aerophilus]
MSVTGLCGICEVSPAIERCRGCGTLVCHTHYREKTELCVECGSDGDSGGPTRQF